MAKDLAQLALELCWKIEAFPASEQQTEISEMASELKSKIEQLQALAIKATIETTNALHEADGLKGENERLRAVLGWIENEVRHIIGGGTWWEMMHDLHKDSAFKDESEWKLNIVDMIDAEIARTKQYP